MKCFRCFVEVTRHNASNGKMEMFRTRVLWLMMKNKYVVDVFRVSREEIMNGKGRHVERIKVSSTLCIKSCMQLFIIRTF